MGEGAGVVRREEKVEAVGKVELAEKEQSFLWAASGARGGAIRSGLTQMQFARDMESLRAGKRATSSCTSRRGVATPSNRGVRDEEGRYAPLRTFSGLQKAFLDVRRA
jgi:hypothetical protein